MTHKIFTLLCVLSLLGMSTPYDLYAASSPHTSDIQSGQLRAISSYLTRTYTKNTSPLTDAEMREIISEGISWMQSAQEENGHFAYEYVPYEDRYSVDDNIVRQAGALYILGEAVRREKDIDGIDETIEKAISYFETLSKTGTYDGKTFRCIVEKTTSKRCKLGATSLALIGTLSYVDAFPEKKTEYKHLIEDYRTYILAMQKESGGFREVYRTDTKTPLEKESSFANGEALLALVRTYTYEESGDVKDAIDAAFNYLKVQPYDANLYLWIMAAVKDMETFWPSDVYTTYAREFTKWRLDYGVKHPRTRNYCAYAEGLASAASILKNEPIYTALRREIDIRNRSHQALQLTDTDTMRIIQTPDGLALKTLETPGLALGGFLVSDAEPSQRIDFTQHCLASYIQTLVDLDGNEL